MCSALVVVGLALVLALQIAIHLRLANIPARAAAHIRLEVLNRARAEADALKEGTAKGVGEIVKSLNQHHDRVQRYQLDLAERHRAEIATLQARARERAAHANSFADLVVVLRDVTDELRELRDDEGQRKTVETPEARRTVLSPPPDAATSPATDDEPDDAPTTVAPWSAAASSQREGAR